LLREESKRLSNAYSALVLNECPGNKINELRVESGDSSKLKIPP